MVLFFILFESQLKFLNKMSVLKPFLVIRNYKQSDESNCQELIRNYVMSFVKKSFLAFCFKEITLQIVVISWAILFIFFGVPLSICALTVPGCIFFIFLLTYFSFYAKAIELINTKPNQSLVAEIYEPFLINHKTAETTFLVFFNESPYNSAFKNKFRKKIIGTISVKNHVSLYNAGWIYRFAIGDGYPFRKIAEPLLNLVIQDCFSHGYCCLECSLSEWQEEERDLLDSFGFVTSQIYHKQIIGNSLSVLKSQLSLNLNDDQSLQKSN